MREAVPIAIGLALACAFAAIWVRLAVRPMELLRVLPSGRVEGSTVEVAVELRPSGGVLPARATLVDDAGQLGQQTCEARRRGEVLRGVYELRDLPRGRYLLHGAALLVDDPFGLARVEVPLEREDALSVYPRIVQLDTLFSEGGPLGGHDRRLLLSRVSGYDLHGVRDHVRGESLRAVHWKTSARLRKLMVKEFEDTPRDEAVVLLDAHAGSVVGSAPASSFETQVRAAGSLLRRIAIAGQRASLVVAGDRLQRQRVTSLEHDWPASLELLAAVHPDGTRPLASALGGERRARRSSRLDRDRAARRRPRRGGRRARRGPPRRRRGVGRRRLLATGAAGVERASRGRRAARRARRPRLPGAPRRQPARAAAGAARAGATEGCVRRAWPEVALPLALYAALCAFVAWHVESLQDPRLSAGDLVPLVALALAPALVARTFGAARLVDRRDPRRDRRDRGHVGDLAAPAPPARLPRPGLVGAAPRHPRLAQRDAAVQPHARAGHPHRRPAHDPGGAARGGPRPARPLPAAARDRGRPGPVRHRLDRLRARASAAARAPVPGLRAGAAGARRRVRPVLGAAPAAARAGARGDRRGLRRDHREPARRRPRLAAAVAGLEPLDGQRQRRRPLRLEPDLHRPSLALEEDRGPAGRVPAPRVLAGDRAAGVRRLPLDAGLLPARRRRDGRHLARHRPRPEPGRPADRQGLVHRRGPRRAVPPVGGPARPLRAAARARPGPDRPGRHRPHHEHPGARHVLLGDREADRPEAGRPARRRHELPVVGDPGGPGGVPGHGRPVVRHAEPRGAHGPALRVQLGEPQARRLEEGLRVGPHGARQAAAAEPVRHRDRARDVLPDALLLRRARRPVRRQRPAAAELDRERHRRLLPDVLGLDGRAPAAARDPGAGRRGLHQRNLRPEASASGT